MGRVLVGCEYSGVVREAFRTRGHEAYSCDLLPSEDNSDYHLQGDVREQLGKGWDLAIFHPTCTYLCSSGLHWNKRTPGRQELTEEALAFVRALLEAPINKIALENPVGCISSRVRKPDQIVQPHEYGDDASKATCLWLVNLPTLCPTNTVEPRYVCCSTVFNYALGKYGCPNCNGSKAALPRWGNQTNSGQNKLGPSEDRWKERSRTYRGIANAMADQWGRLLP